MRFFGLQIRGSYLSIATLKLSLTALAIGLTLVADASAQFNNNGLFQRVVGGVSIDANGILKNASEEEQTTALAALRQQLVGPNGALAQAANRRMISLSNLQKIVLESEKSGKPVPEEVMFLGGLTRIENVFVYPERHDIVLSGPSEPWKIGPNGSAVGANSGRPIVLLDDLLCAFKTVFNARNTGISVSIEPTEQGALRLTQLLKQIGAQGGNPKAYEHQLVEAFGPQQIKLEGIPADSHMARVILAADYKMKLYGMNLAHAPVKGLPSYLEMIQNRSNVGQIQSRWWMACDYQSIEHSADNLAWKLNGRGIKTLTEQEQMDGKGKFKQSGKADATAKKWADLFTKKLDELAVVDTVFGDLRNVMDLCVIAAIIQSNDLQGIASCDLTPILGERATVQLAKLDTPTSLDPQCTFIQSVQGWLVSASGGVLVDSWEIASHTKVNDSLASDRNAATAWSNADSIWQ